jgi:hypothetical protein
MIRVQTKRLLSPLVALSLFAPLGLVGCGDTSETKTKTEQSTPAGTTTETQINKVNQTGNNPPPPTGGTEAPK